VTRLLSDSENKWQINNILMKDGIMLHTHTHIHRILDPDVNVDVLTTFVHKSYILIHLVCQFVIGLGKGRVGHGVGTGGNWARIGHALGTHWAWARTGHGHGQDWAQTGHRLGTVTGGTGHGLGTGTGGLGTNGLCPNVTGTH